MDWLRRPAAPRQPLAAQASAPAAPELTAQIEHSAPGLREALARLPRPGGSVLDLGAVSSVNVEFFNRYQAKLCVLDFETTLAEAGLWERPAKLPPWMARVPEVLEQIEKKIVIACYPESIPIYKIAFKGINYCELDHSYFFFNDRFVKFKVKKKLKAYRPEIIVDLIGSMASALLIFDIRAKKIIGLHNEQFKAVYDCEVKFRQTPQLVDIYLDALSPILNVKI